MPVVRGGRQEKAVLEPASQVGGHADDDCRFTLGPRDDRDDTRPDTPFQIVGKRTQFATGDIPGFVHLYAGEEAIARLVKS